jgi:hypothetical protein
MEVIMRLRTAFILAGALPALAVPVSAAPHASRIAAPDGAIVKVQQSGRDCTPTNGPFGFYGNIWCQPPNEQSYLRNLGSRWPMETPPSLRKPKPQRGNPTDW